MRTNFSCYARVQAAEDDIAFTELARLALLNHQIAHGAHGGGLLPLDGIAVLLAGGLWRSADSDELQEGVVLEQEDEALADGAGGAEDTWIEQHVSAWSLLARIVRRGLRVEDDRPHFFSENLVAMFAQR